MGRRLLSYIPFAQSLYLAQPVAPGRDRLTTVACIPNLGEYARVDGDETAICGQVLATDHFAFCGRRYFRKAWFRDDLHFVIAVLTVWIFLEATFNE